MGFDYGQILVWLVVGALAGSTAGMLVKRKRTGFGRWGNLGVGLVGSLLGGGLFQLLGVDLGLARIAVSLQDLIAALLGSLLFLGLLTWWRRRRGAG